MSHRIGRVAHIIRDVVSDAIANKLSDPRISRFTSVTRIELSPDLRIADVYVSVMGSESDGRTTMQGLESARGLLQTRVAKNLDMRQCPLLRLHLDLSLKRAAHIQELIAAATPPVSADGQAAVARTGEGALDAMSDPPGHGDIE
jgi:ribosome-binding factor A